MAAPLRAVLLQAAEHHASLHDNIAVVHDPLGFINAFRSEPGLVDNADVVPTREELRNKFRRYGVRSLSESKKYPRYDLDVIPLLLEMIDVVIGSDEWDLLRTG
eukprot:8627702-Pyramimonas_sp.AAC.2